MEGGGSPPYGRAFKRIGLRPLDCWNCGIESRWKHGFCLLWVA